MALFYVYCHIFWCMVTYHNVRNMVTFKNNAIFENSYHIFLNMVSFLNISNMVIFKIRPYMDYITMYASCFYINIFDLKPKFCQFRLTCVKLMDLSGTQHRNGFK